MSRMDKYKKIHKESEKEERKNRGSAFRRETKNTTPKQTVKNEYFEANREADRRVDQEPRRTPESTDREKNLSPLDKIKSINGKRPAFLKRKPKDPYQPRKKRNWKRIVLGIFLFLIAFSIVTFGIGNYQAKHDSSMPAIETQSFDGPVNNNGSTNILLLGSDTRDNVTGRSDSMMVLQVDGSGKTKLVSFMRDMYLDIPGYGKNKLNAAYANGGADLVRQTLKENFGIDCRYYAMVDFQTFEKGIDALFPNGVKIDAEKDMSAYIDEPISKGEQQMNGHTLLNYARFRMDEEGDFGRVRRQQQVIGSVTSQLKNPLILFRAPYAMGKVFGYLSTDISNWYIISHFFSFVKMAGGIERLTLPVDGSWSYIDTSNAGSALSVDTATNSSQVQAFLGE